jgi:hypothetical protein
MITIVRIEKEHLPVIEKKVELEFLILSLEMLCKETGFSLHKEVDLDLV